VTKARRIEPSKDKENAKRLVHQFVGAIGQHIIELILDGERERVSPQEYWDRNLTLDFRLKRWEELPEELQRQLAILWSKPRGEGK
jgi:hypothetical protein